jgi:hypothetical protein
MKFVKFGDPAPGTEAPQRPAINLTQKAWSALILTRYVVAMRMRAAIFQSVALAFGLTMALSGTGQAQQLKVCKSTFALCTIAPCDPIPGNDNQVSCHCTVNQSYSAGSEPCTGVQQTAEGQQIHSRYYPVKSYAICTNDRPWAWCLDKPCIIDENNPEAAACTCDVVKNLGAYVIVTSKYTPATCTTGVISSATVPQIDQATSSLKSAEVLPPFPIQVWLL